MLVQRVKAEAKTKGGLFLPESSVKELNEATVLAVGPGGLDKEGKRMPMGVKEGDKVLIPQVGTSTSPLQPIDTKELRAWKQWKGRLLTRAQDLFHGS